MRGIVRDNIRASLPGADATVPNSVLRVLSDNQAAVAHMVLQYINWLSLQLMPDTAETEWLDRHGEIWLVNADGSTGRKLATFAAGTASFTGDLGVIVPAGTQLTGPEAIGFETTEDITLGIAETTGPIRALDPGSAGNLDAGTVLNIATSVPNVNGDVIVVTLAGGTETETDADLRTRVLGRIQQPPQGGAQHDYVEWAKDVPGVTRAWANPLEMGMGTVTVRFMMDDLRADDNGFPNGGDIEAVRAYLDSVRPVAVKDFFVVSPIPQRVDVYIDDLVPDTAATRAAIEESLKDMLRERAAPGQTIFAAWKSQAIMNTPGVTSFTLNIPTDDVMESPGHMAILGDIVYGISP